MKLQFRHQKFQAEAAKAVVDVFAGQPYMTPSYRMDRGEVEQQVLFEEEQDTSYCVKTSGFGDSGTYKKYPERTSDSSF